MHTHRYSKVTPACYMHMKVGFRGEVPVKHYRFSLGGENVAWQNPKIPDTSCTCHALNEGEGWMRQDNEARPTALMKQTPC